MQSIDTAPRQQFAIHITCFVELYIGLAGLETGCADHQMLPGEFECRRAFHSEGVLAPILELRHGAGPDAPLIVPATIESGVQLQLGTCHRNDNRMTSQRAVNARGYRGERELTAPDPRQFGLRMYLLNFSLINLDARFRLVNAQPRNGDHASFQIGLDRRLVHAAGHSARCLNAPGVRFTKSIQVVRVDRKCQCVVAIAEVARQREIIAAVTKRDIGSLQPGR